MHELTAMFDPRKSFYGKAHYILTDTGADLYSYTTKVSTWNRETGEITGETWSRTTTRHQREFEKQIQAGYIR